MTQAYELACSVETAPQCCVCNHVAEHKCAACGEQICGGCAKSCDFCDVESQKDWWADRMPKPTKFYCDECVSKAEDDTFVCREHKPAFLAEAAAVMKAERDELTEDLRRCQAKLNSEYPLEQRIGFAEQMVERWIGRLSA